jgi:isoaspartyl peptidase/L-asparaginase-like protein (Ntn-hydrolase superfamily)
MERRKATLAIHGGAGGQPNIPPHLEEAYRAALRRSLVKGYKVLANGGSALDAVCKSVQELEDDPLFNAGKGAVFTTDGRNECEASVMTAYAPKQKHDTQALLQRNRRCASAVLIRYTRNPILLAKALFEHGKENPHVILSGKTAEELGWQLGCEKVDSAYYYTRKRWLEHRRELGLPDDDDPAMCAAVDDREDDEEEEEEEEVEPELMMNPIDPPPSYYANTNTDETPSLSSSSQDARLDSDDEFDEKEVSRSMTTDEAVTPTSQSTTGESNNGDMGLQYFIDWDLNFDTRSHRRDHRASTDDGNRSSREGGSWRSSSFVELPLPSDATQASCYRRHQSDHSLSYLPQGTVGAVALDDHGNLAVATSTGGVTNKLPGRIGDTPTPGAGFWAEYWKTDLVSRQARHQQQKPTRCVTKEEKATSVEKTKRRACGTPCNWVRYIFGSRAESQEQQDEEDAIEQASNSREECFTATPKFGDYRGVALSGTGTGDYFIRCSFASLVVHRMRFLGEGVDVASKKAVAELGELGGVGGVICLDEQGRGEQQHNRG